jgi:hypothetical protein
MVMAQRVASEDAGESSLDYKTAFLNATASGNTEVVAAVARRKIRVCGYTLSNGGGAAIAVNFQSGTTAISSTKTLAATGGGMVVRLGQGFVFETSEGVALNINLDASGTVGVDIIYLEG